MVDFCYIILFAETVLIFILAVFLWSKTKEIAFPVGIALLYFWSLFGAWQVIYDYRENITTSNYYYLFNKIFPINVDATYLQTIIFYGVFILVVEIVALLFVRPRIIKNPVQGNLVYISANTIYGIGFLSVFLSYLIVRNHLELARQLGISGYVILRGGTYGGLPLGTIHQILNSIAIFIWCFSGALLMSSKNPMVFVFKKNLGTILSWLILGAVVVIFNIIIGSRSSLLVGTIIFLFVYIYNSQRVNFMLLIGVVFVMVMFLSMIQILRGYSMSQLALQNVSLKISLKGVEPYAAHFSLYGVLLYNIPITYGTSFISFIVSLVPHIIWANRPPGIYNHYAQYIAAAPGQGYTIHHAAGWYLNFGFIGILLGASILGLIWAKFFNLLSKTTIQSTFKNIFCSISFYTFTASFPVLVRNGLEGYKGVFIENVLISAFIIFISTRTFSKE